MENRDQKTRQNVCTMLRSAILVENYNRWNKFIVPYFFRRVSFSSAAFLMTLDDSVAVILMNIHGLPQYHESSTFSSISFIKTTVGIKVIDENSWSAASTICPWATKTFLPLFTAAFGQLGSPNLILFLSLVLKNDASPLNWMAISLAYSQGPRRRGSQGACSSSLYF